MRPLPYGEWLELGEGVRARFLNVGHILGSAMVEVRMPLGGKEQGIVFSGDVGRYDMPLHSDPSEPPACSLLVVESTYGNRTHDGKPLAEQITEPFKKVFEQKGIVLIPSFAVGRAQLVTLILRELMNDGRLPEVPIHIDSPMAVNATRIYSRHLEDGSLDDELPEDGRSRLFPRNVQFHRHGGRVEGAEQTSRTTYHHFRKRHAHRRPCHSSLTPTSAGQAKPHLTGGLPSGRDTRAGAIGRCQGPADARKGRPGSCSVPLSTRPLRARRPRRDHPMAWLLEGPAPRQFS